MAIVMLGNPQPAIAGSTVDEHGNGVVKVVTDPESDIATVLRDLFHDDGTPNVGLWVAHSTAPAPAWVESDDAELAQAIADHAGCRVGRTV